MFEIANRWGYFQVEAYRTVMYENIEEERTFWIKVLNEFTPKFIDAVSTAIISKLATAMNGGDISIKEDSGSEKNPNDPFLDTFVDGLSPDDFKKLRKAGVDVSKLTIIKGETLGGQKG